jgi:hypothetical protein
MYNKLWVTRILPFKVMWPESGRANAILIRLIAQRQVKSYVARKVQPSKVTACRNWLVKQWTAHRLMNSIKNVQTSGWEADCQERHVGNSHHKSQIFRFGKIVNKEIKIRMLYIFFWVIPLRLYLYADVLEHCLFHLHRQAGMKNDYVWELLNYL